MNAKPKDAIERMKAWLESKDFYDLCQNYRHARDIKPHREGADTAAGAFERIKREIAGYLPDGAVCVVWPAELTRERLEEFADEWRVQFAEPCKALLAIAAIAPQRKKRVVNIWGSIDAPRKLTTLDIDSLPPGNWKLVARNVELED